MRTTTPLKTILRVFAWTLIDKYTGRDAPTFRDDTPDPARIHDMLRYDAAFINRKYPSIVLTLRVRVRNRGMHRGEATIARWSSFGYLLREGELPYQVLDESDDWITFVHARESDGRTDYTKLEPITLRAWMQHD